MNSKKIFTLYDSEDNIIAVSENLKEIEKVLNEVKRFDCENGIETEYYIDSDYILERVDNNEN